MSYGDTAPMGVIVEDCRAAAAREPMARVLLVESNEVERLTHVRLLKHSRCAFSISAVDTLHAALLSVRSRPYDVILLDIDTREPNATAVIKELALAAPGAAILVLASRADYSMATLACELGAQDYLVKEELNRTVLIRALRCAIGRKRHEARLTEWAYMDALTGLVNRRLFSDRLTHALARATRADKGAALLFIDLDNFKTINDSLGHEVGDDVLRGVAQVLRGAVRQTDTVGRFGGDEFVVLLEPLEDFSRVDLVAKKVLRALDAGSTVPAPPVKVTASIGVGLFPKHAIREDALLRSADAAMFLAKQSGGNCIQLARAREL
jgi:two-component system cell cycle response regulator